EAPAARVRRRQIESANGRPRRAPDAAPDRAGWRERAEAVDRTAGRIEVVVHRQRRVEDRGNDVRSETGKLTINRGHDGSLPLLSFGVAVGLVEVDPVGQ